MSKVNQLFVISGMIISFFAVMLGAVLATETEHYFLGIVIVILFGLLMVAFSTLEGEC